MKIGEIKYANVFPIFHYLKKTGNYNFITGTPSFLNKTIRENALDAGVCSSIEYAKRPSSYSIVPDISISSVGEVKSVCLFSEKPIRQLDRSMVYLTAESGTSVVLLKILLNYYFNTKVFYTDSLEESDAALFIGDTALFKYYNTSYKYIYDLGFHWYNYTGLPFVFALWIINKNFRDYVKINQLKKDLKYIKQNSKKNLAALLDKYSFEGLTSYQILDYWDIINYDFTEKHIYGLLKFYSLSCEIGEIKAVPPLSFFHCP